MIGERINVNSAKRNFYIDADSIPVKIIDLGLLIED